MRQKKKKDCIRAYLVLLSRLLGQRHNRRNAHRQMVSAHVVDARLLDQRPDVRLLEMLKLVVVGGGQVRAHAALVAGDDDATAARRVLLVDAVLDAQPRLLGCIAEDVGILVAADAA